MHSDIKSGTLKPHRPQLPIFSRKREARDSAVLSWCPRPVVVLCRYIRPANITGYEVEHSVVLVTPSSCLLRPSLKPRGTGPANRCTIANVAILTLAYDESRRRAVSPQTPLHHHFIITNNNIKSEHSGPWSHWLTSVRHTRGVGKAERAMPGSYRHLQCRSRMSAVRNVAVQHAIFLILDESQHHPYLGEMVTRQYHETVARYAN